MRSILKSGLTLGLAALVVIGGLHLAGVGIFDFLGNPFRSERIERIDPAVLHAINDLDTLEAASAELEVVIEVEDDTRFLPDFVSGQQVTYLAAGSVQATVDLGEAVVGQKADGTVVVTLPEPELADVHVDSERSQVLDRDRGLFDRIGDVFTDSPDDDSDLYLLAESELVRAAGEDGELLERAQASATDTVTGLLGKSGVDDVVVRFSDPTEQASDL